MTETEKKLVRDFLAAISRVPMRAIDCNQAEVNRLYAKLADLADYE